MGLVAGETQTPSQRMVVVMTEKLTACKDCGLYLGRHPETREDTCSVYLHDYGPFDYWNGEFGTQFPMVNFP